MRTPSCSMWDSVPWPGIKPRPPALGAQSPSHWTTREVPILCLIFYRTALVSSTTAVPFYLPTRVPVSSHPCHFFCFCCCYCCFHMKTILVDVKWYFTVVLICISLMICSLFVFINTLPHAWWPVGMEIIAPLFIPVRQMKLSVQWCLLGMRGGREGSTVWLLYPVLPPQ